MRTPVGEVSGSPRALNVAEAASLVNQRLCSAAIAEAAMLLATKQFPERTAVLLAIVEKSLAAHRKLVYRRAAQIVRHQVGGESGQVLAEILIGLADSQESAS
jgi:hypothetical protein